MQQQILVFGKPLERMPKDLYIPPEALRVLLSAFEGPLDLLLYLIRKHNIDILDIPVAMITEQYLAYVDAMKESDMTVVAEYLLMAATLAEIKARMMLPRALQSDDDDIEQDPRTDLAAQLLAYARNSKAAEQLSLMAFVGNGILLSAHSAPVSVTQPEPPSADLDLLGFSMQRLLSRQALRKAHAVEKERWSLSTRMDMMMATLNTDEWHGLHDFYTIDEGRGGLVVSLMAMLELDKRQQLQWQQETLFSPVYMRARVEVV